MILTAAAATKRRTYSELASADDAHFVVLAVEVAGRWSDEALDFLRKLATARARSASKPLQQPSLIPI